MSWNKHKASQDDVVIKNKAEKKKMICIFLMYFISQHCWPGEAQVLDNRERVFFLSV